MSISVSMFADAAELLRKMNLMFRCYYCSYSQSCCYYMVLEMEDQSARQVGCFWKVSAKYIKADGAWCNTLETIESICWQTGSQSKSTK